MSEQEVALSSLNPGAKNLVKSVEQTTQQAPPGVNYWLIALLERHGPMAETLAAHLDSKAALAYARAQLAEGRPGEELTPAAVVEKSLQKARARGKEVATERDIASVILGFAGYMLLDT